MNYKLVKYLILIVALCQITNESSAQKVNLLPDTVGMCWGDSVVLQASFIAAPKNTTYRWITPDGIKDFFKSIPAKKQGRYSIRVKTGNVTYADSTYVKYYPKPKINFSDTSICNTTLAILDAKNVGAKYLWSTDETSQRIKIENQGKYWVKINNRGCSASDTFMVFFNQGATPNFGAEITFCMSEENKVLSIKNVPGTRVLWSNGATTTSITATKAGYYWVKTQSALCGSKTDSVNVKLKACDCEILVPNSFTPNEDDKNDYFYPVLPCEYSSYTFIIYDRWQNPVFTTSNVNGKWDGRFKGNLCPDDIYFWHIETIEKGSGKKDVRDGKVSLFR